MRYLYSYINIYCKYYLYVSTAIIKGAAFVYIDDYYQSLNSNLIQH
ncbi:hypothetical protein AB162_049 [Candidatus Palibaumannia cicadellinicola]|uniref:Uncharacterized protein n=1 Tax=Candidatus Palibaumannia cicadellinicola TaxID=186490 RepID=A0A0K2BKE7_9GAMM|nr:hypothetical protein AB162_049 [Candidatus Baumannia cicadellinicola]